MIKELVSIVTTNIMGFRAKLANFWGHQSKCSLRYLRAYNSMDKVSIFSMGSGAKLMNL